MSKSWVYHEIKPPIIIDDCMLDSYLKDGWAETPAAFRAAEEKKIMKKSGTIDLCGFEYKDLNLLNEFTESELLDFAEAKFGVKLNGKLSKKMLLKEIKKLLKQLEKRKAEDK